MDRSGLTAVQGRIAEAAVRAGRSPEDITLVVVSKYASDVAVRSVMDEGASVFGESRASALGRRAAEFPGVEWHFIGHLQRNKASQVKRVAGVVHSMDRTPLAQAWARAATGDPAVFVQVNLAGEPQKGGADPTAVPGLIDHCVALDIPVVGLMTIPPLAARPEDSRRWFAALRELRDNIAMDFPAVTGLSMGMTDDFEVAVTEGATVLRVGRAIFDPLEGNED